MKNRNTFLNIFLFLITLLYLSSCNECRDLICLNGGECQNGECVCPSGFTGLNCECEILECQNGGFFVEESCECECPVECKGNNCETCPEILDFQALPLLGLCPDQILGDKEVGGEPTVKLSTIIRFTKTDVWLDIEFSVEEKKNDFSTASSSWRIKLWTVPEDYEILNILLDTPQPQLVSGTIDKSKELDCSPENNKTYISKTCINGNTSGSDIGNCTTDDAYVDIYFNPIFVEIIKCL